MAKKTTAKRDGKAKPAPKAAEVKKPAGPTAKMCPRVLDGEVDARDFSPDDCLKCEEFDCRFSEGTQGSGALRSRLFASDDEADDGDDGWGGSDLDFDGGTDESGDEEGEDPF